MTTRALPAPQRIPDVSYGPFCLLEAVPWLMLAAAMRTLMSLPASIVASFSLFLAFLLVARRMIEFTQGRTGLDKVDFGGQLRLARRILARVLLLLALAVSVGVALGWGRNAAYLAMGFDGIAFDQFSRVGMLWSCVLAAVVLIMVVNAGQDAPIGLLPTLRELAARSVWLVPAIVVAFILQLVLNHVQGVVRWPLLMWWKTAVYPQAVKNLFYFFFIFTFASVRLWATLAVLTFALRESYRRDNA